MESNPTSQGKGGLETAFKEFWRWTQRAMRSRKTKRLRVRETLSLGERRFLAVIEFDSQEFLVGGTGSSLALLARLHEGMVLPEPPTPTQTPVA
jgi:flagellar biogenesis protein FliO